MSEMAVSPNPRTLMLPDPDAIPSFLSDKFLPLFGAVLGFSAVMFSRSMNRRPYLSGIQQHIMALLGGGLLGKFVLNKTENYFAERDAVVRHYIELHPEDFPMPERKKVGEVFSTWTPIR